MTYRSVLRCARLTYHHSLRLRYVVCAYPIFAARIFVALDHRSIDGETISMGGFVVRVYAAVGTCVSIWINRQPCALSLNGLAVGVTVR